MAKLKAGQITEADLAEYLQSESDFSFEMQTLSLLQRMGLECEHGGHYEDPVTGLSREFDIRTQVSFGQLRLRMAIECKNIRENFPLLVSCVPRQPSESYHQVAAVKDRKPNPILLHQIQSRAVVFSITGDHSIYKASAPVGKSTAQVGRTPSGDLTSNDSELFGKWGQALASATDLVSRMYWDGDEDDSEDAYISAVLPAVVVPDDRLWVVEYDTRGNVTSGPKKTEHCSCFVDKSYTCGSERASATYWISHLELFTINGLRSFVSDVMSSEAGLQTICTRSGLQEAMTRKLQDK